MEIGIAHFVSRRRALVAALLIVFASAGCSVGPSPSPAHALLSASASSPTATSMPSAAPTPTLLPLSTSLPAGKWTGVHWTKVISNDPHWLIPDQPPETGSNVENLGWSTFGWSHGYISFDTVVTTHADYSWTGVTSIEQSLDGVSWTPSGGFARSGDSDEDPFSSNGVVGVVEGAGGLLAYTGDSSVCTWVSRYYSPVAASPDGVNWTNVSQSLGSIQIIDGAGAGYIALGGAGLFTSVDGLRWTKAALTGKAFARLDLVQSGTVADDGFVISGVTFGPEGDGCGSGPALLNPTLWFSRDGKVWKKLSLPGAIAGPEVSLDVCHVGRFLVANEAGQTAKSWTSTDGMTWLASRTDFWCADTRDDPWFLEGGGREMFVASAQDGSAKLTLVNDDLTETPLAQSGDLPDWNNVGFATLGPAGVVASTDDGTLYFGAPVTQ